MPTRLTDKPLPKPSAIREAIDELREVGLDTFLDGDGLGFAYDLLHTSSASDQAVILRAGNALSYVVENFGIPPQIHHYNDLGFDVRWDGVENSGEWRLTLFDRRTDEFRDIKGSKQILIDAHYDAE